MANLASLWIGEALGEIEVASARSFLRQGDTLTVYTYSEVANIPDGVDVRDANTIFSGDPILRYAKSGSPALHANLFRYALMARTDAIWVDLDIIALRPFEFDTQWVFGRENANQVNNAVLRLPPNSQTLKRLLEFRPDQRGAPPGYSGRRALGHWLKNKLSGGTPITSWPWGTTGPKALTRYLNETGEIEHVMPKKRFYPVHWKDAGRFATPGAFDESELSPECFGVHLWGKQLRQFMKAETNGKAPPGSYIADVLAR